MKADRARRLSVLTLAFVVIFIAAEGGYGQESDVSKYPSRPITFIVPNPPGSESDVPCRLIAKEAEKFLRQPIVVVNKPGGSFTIGVAAIVNAKPDGYTIGHAGAPGLFYAPLMGNVPYRPLSDLKMIMQFGDINLGIFVKGDSPFQQFSDLVAYARKNPKKLVYGVGGGPGSVGHLVMEQIGKREKVQFTLMPFKGSPEAHTALLGGHVQAASGGFSQNLLEAGSIRLLVLFAEKRSELYPNVPTLKELGYNIPAPAMLLVAGPKGIPEGIARKLEEAFAKATKEPGFIKGMKTLNLSTFYRNSRELTDYVTDTYQQFGKLLAEIEHAE